MARVSWTMWLFLDGDAGVGSVAVNLCAAAATTARSSVVDSGVVVGVVVVLITWNATNTLYELAWIFFLILVPVVRRFWARVNAVFGFGAIVVGVFISGLYFLVSSSVIIGTSTVILEMVGQGGSS